MSVTIIDKVGGKHFAPLSIMKAKCDSLTDSLNFCKSTKNPEIKSDCSAAAVKAIVDYYSVPNCKILNTQELSFEDICDLMMFIHEYEFKDAPSLRNEIIWRPISKIGYNTLKITKGWDGLSDTDRMRYLLSCTDKIDYVDKEHIDNLVSRLIISELIDASRDSLSGDIDWKRIRNGIYYIDGFVTLIAALNPRDKDGKALQKSIDLVIIDAFASGKFHPNVAKLCAYISYYNVGGKYLNEAFDCPSWVPKILMDKRKIN